MVKKKRKIEPGTTIRTPSGGMSISHKELAKRAFGGGGSAISTPTKAAVEEAAGKGGTYEAYGGGKGGIELPGGRTFFGLNKDDIANVMRQQQLAPETFPTIAEAGKQRETLGEIEAIRGAAPGVPAGGLQPGVPGADETALQKFFGWAPETPTELALAATGAGVLPAATAALGAAGGVVSTSGLAASPGAVAINSAGVATTGFLSKIVAFGVKGLGTLAAGFGVFKVLGAAGQRIASAEQQLEAMGETVEQVVKKPRLTGKSEDVIEAASSIRDMEIEVDRLESVIKLNENRDYNKILDPEGTGKAYKKIARIKQRIDSAYTELEILAVRPTNFDQEGFALFEIELEQRAREMGLT